MPIRIDNYIYNFGLFKGIYHYFKDKYMEAPQAKRPNGAWIENKNRTYCIRADLDTITCNKCGYDYPKCKPLFSRKYCPNCGAKMDGERSEE